VWDFVFPMVHGDLDDVDDHGATADEGDSSTQVQHRLSARDATATYVAPPPNDSASRRDGSYFW
jgi:hypothetical protein